MSSKFNVTLFSRTYFILCDIVNPQLGSGLGSEIGLGLGLDSMRGFTISHKMKCYYPFTPCNRQLTHLIYTAEKVLPTHIR